MDENMTTGKTASEAPTRSGMHCDYEGIRYYSNETISVSNRPLSKIFDAISEGVKGQDQKLDRRITVRTEANGKTSIDLRIYTIRKGFNDADLAQVRVIADRIMEQLGGKTASESAEKPTTPVGLRHGGCSTYMDRIM